MQWKCSSVDFRRATHLSHVSVQPLGIKQKILLFTFILSNFKVHGQTLKSVALKIALTGFCSSKGTTIEHAEKLQIPLELYKRDINTSK